MGAFSSVKCLFPSKNFNEQKRIMNPTTTNKSIISIAPATRDLLSFCTEKMVSFPSTIEFGYQLETQHQASRVFLLGNCGLNWGSHPSPTNPFTPCHQTVIFIMFFSFSPQQTYATFPFRTIIGSVQLPEEHLHMLTCIVGQAGRKHKHICQCDKSLVIARRQWWRQKQRKVPYTNLYHDGAI